MPIARRRGEGLAGRWGRGPGAATPRCDGRHEYLMDCERQAVPSTHGLTGLRHRCTFHVAGCCVALASVSLLALANGRAPRLMYGNLVKDVRWHGRLAARSTAATPALPPAANTLLGARAARAGLAAVRTFTKHPIESMWIGPMRLRPALLILQPQGLLR